MTPARPEPSGAPPVRSEPSGADRPRARWNVLAAALALVVLLGWRGVVSATGVLRELTRADVPAEHRFTYLRAAFTRGEDERIRDGLARREGRRGLPAGLEWELFTLLRREVPAGGEVHLHAAPTPRSASAFSDLQTLLHPRRFFTRRGLPEGFAPPPELGGSVFVLELGPREGPSPARWFERVAEGDGWVLWRLGGAGR